MVHVQQLYNNKSRKKNERNQMALLTKIANKTMKMEQAIRFLIILN